MNSSIIFQVNYTGCLKICEFRIQSVVGDYFSSPNMEIKKKSGFPPQRLHWSEGHSLKCVFFKYRLKSIYELHWVLPYHALNSKFDNFETPCSKKCKQGKMQRFVYIFMKKMSPVISITCMLPINDNRHFCES
jgi:hypothetical protein